MRFIFNKKRGDCKAIKAWEELGFSEQRLLNAKLNLGVNEVPIGVILEGVNHVVITTKKIIWSLSHDSHAIFLADIKSVDAPQFMDVSKSDLCALRLISRTGQEYIMQTEPGGPLFFLWNFLLYVIPLIQQETVMQNSIE